MRHLRRPHGVVHRLVGEQRVVTVHVVLHHHLPVAVHPVLHPARRQLDAPGGRQRHEAVDRVTGVAQVFAEGDAVSRERGEDEPAVALLPWRPDQAECRPDLAEPLGVAVAHRHARQAAVVAERPAVVWAAEGAAVALVRVAQPVAPVRTPVGHHPDLAVLAAGDHVRLARDALGDVVTWLGDLALVSDEHPALAEDAAHLQVVHLGVGVHEAADTVRLDERADVTGAEPGPGLGRRAGLVGNRHDNNLLSVMSDRRRGLWGARTAGSLAPPTVRKAISTGGPMSGACPDGASVVRTRRCPLASSTSITWYGPVATMRPGSR